MASSAERIRTVGIECESLEGDSWGVSRIVRELIRVLSRRGDLVGRWRFVLYCKRTVPAEFAGLDPALFSVRVVGMPSFSLYYYVALPIRLWRERPDVMFYPNYMLPIIHPPRVRSVVMLTEDIYREMKNPRLGLRYRIAYRIFAAGWAAWRATRVLAISHASADALRSLGIPASRLVANPLGVSVTRSGMREPGFYLLYAGQAFERRHLRESLAAFTELAAADPDLEFRIIGPDRYRPAMLADTVRHINHRLGRTAVTWRERVSEPELAAAFRGARAVVYVSDAEAFGLPPLEALAYGTPAVVADAPVTRELFGTNAFFAKGTDVPALADAFRSALYDRASHARIAAAASDTAARFTWERFGERFLKTVRFIAP